MSAITVIVVFAVPAFSSALSAERLSLMDLPDHNKTSPYPPPSSPQCPHHIDLPLHPQPCPDLAPPLPHPPAHPPAIRGLPIGVELAETLFLPLDVLRRRGVAGRRQEGETVC